MARLTLQETMDRLLLLIRAGYPVIYIVSHEEMRVFDYLAKIYRVIKAEQPYKYLHRWYEGVGLEEMAGLEPITSKAGPYNWLNLEGMPPEIRVVPHGGLEDPWESLNNIKLAKKGFPELENSLTVFFDIHQYLQTNATTSITGPLVRPLRNTADALRRYYDVNRSKPRQPYKTIVIIAPSAAGLSPELENDLIVIDFPLPESDELTLTLRNKIEQGQLGFSDQVDSQQQDRLAEMIAGAGRGLTLEDYKLGLNMFAVSGQELSEQHIEDMLNLKAKAINNPALQYTPHVDITLGGLESIRKWVDIRRDTVVSMDVREKYHLPPLKGVMLCGASGGGKSQLAKLIAKEFNLALLRLDIGALFGMYVGESEERTRRALQLAEVLAPIVLWLDEIDKSFQGIGDGGDNGVSARVFGHFLTWLAEKQDNVFVVATANDFKNLLGRFPEFGRKGRFDEIFWVALPDDAARRDIFHIYLKGHVDLKYLDISEKEFEDLCIELSDATVSGNMTGAEIEYAITEALYKAYENRSSNGKSFNKDLIVEVVKSARNRALYKHGSEHWTTLGALQKTALDINMWLPAGNIDKLEV